MELVFENWGLMDYTQALERQELMVESVRHKQKPATVIFCTHSPLVTKGRATQEGDITDWNGPIYDINRGGRATYHGPSQLMIYPIIPLQEASKERRPSDVGSFLRQFELALVDTLHDFGLQAQGKTFQVKGKLPTTANQETGVWIENRKIASLGLSVRHWITFHGAALNIEHDAAAFQGLKPCGFSSSIMTSMEKELGKSLQRNQIIDQIKYHLRIRI